MNEETLFHEARQKPVGERTAFLQQACGDDDALRARIESLLHADGNPDSLLEPKLPATSVSSSLSEAPGQVIGPYKLLQQIGEGGMGTVYMAEQSEPVQRKVALKIIKIGMDSRQVIARFEAERQALALMDHPNIAKMLEAGATETGQPYFVMELVKGISITSYCDQHKLSTEQRLNLFISVCSAVQHAHQKGIIHRDLKPNNVLVADYDDRPVAKIIDFGVAKAVGQPLTERTMFTEFGQVLGTIEYMSPEQAKLNQLDIDTRTDIYSLGVLLYELLAGSTPFDKERLRSAAFDEMLRIIREEEPVSPSTRLSTSLSLPSIAANRHLEPKKLTTLVRGDLDWIVMKSLEKDRARRYETATGLAEDIQRFLTDQPVEARRPTAKYRFRKFARRNRVALISSGFVLLALLAGVVVSTWQAVRATRAEHQALTDRDDKEQALRQADAERRQAEEISKYLMNAFTSPDPRKDGRSITVAEVLERDARTLQDQFNDAPLIKATLLDVIGRSYDGLGLYQESIPLLEQTFEIRKAELGTEHDDTLLAMNHLAEAYWHASMVNNAIGLLEKALAITKTKFGADHIGTLQEAVFLAALYRRAGRVAEAQPMMEDAFKRLKDKLGEEDPGLFWPMQDLADIYKDPKVRRYQDALPLYEQLVRLRKARLGLDHPDTLLAMGGLADTYRLLGRLDEAIPLRQETIDRQKIKLGADHPERLRSMEALASTYRDARRFDDAKSLQLEVFKLRSEALGQGADLKALMDLAKYCNSHKFYVEEIAAYEKLIQLKSDSALYHSYLAQILTNPHAPELNDPKRALELAAKAVELEPHSASTWTALGWVRFCSEDWKASIDAMEKSDSLDKGLDARQRFRLAMAYWHLGRHDVARQWYDKAVERMEKVGPTNASLMNARADASQLLGQAEETAKANITKPEKSLPED